MITVQTTNHLMQLKKKKILFYNTLQFFFKCNRKRDIIHVIFRLVIPTISNAKKKFDEFQISNIFYDRKGNCDKSEKYSISIENHPYN